MKPQFYVGIDPGFEGAIALLSNTGGTAEVHPMPVRDRKGAKELDLDNLYDVLTRLGDSLTVRPTMLVGLEWPNTYAGSFGDVVHHAEVFGRQKGVLESFLYLMGFDYRRVAPNAWKAKLGLPGKTWDKGSLHGAALWDKTYPGLSGLIRGPRGGLLDGPLDALLIAHYLRLGGESPVGWKSGKRPAVFRGGNANTLEDLL